MVKIDKEVLFEFIDSHRKLSKSEYYKNLKLDPSNFAYVAEVKMREALRESGWLEEYQLRDRLYTPPIEGE